MVDFDAWRRDYAAMSFQDHVDFNNQCGEQFPDQRSWKPKPVLTALEGCSSVVELGGWRGELAAHVLPRLPIGLWVNYDVCGWALANTVCDHPNYRAVQLETWAWDTPLERADAFVASHVIEHLTLAHLKRLVARLSVFRVVHFQAPLEHEPSDWDGYHGSHILEVGWAGVEDLMCGWLLTDFSKIHRTWRLP